MDIHTALRSIAHETIRQLKINGQPSIWATMMLAKINHQARK